MEKTGDNKVLLRALLAHRHVIVDWQPPLTSKELQEMEDMVARVVSLNERRWKKRNKEGEEARNRFFWSLWQRLDGVIEYKGGRMSLTKYWDAMRPVLRGKELLAYLREYPNRKQASALAAKPLPDTRSIELFCVHCFDVYGEVFLWHMMEAFRATSAPDTLRSALEKSKKSKTNIIHLPNQSDFRAKQWTRFLAEGKSKARTEALKTLKERQEEYEKRMRSSELNQGESSTGRAQVIAPLPFPRRRGLRVAKEGSRLDVTGGTGKPGRPTVRVDRRKGDRHKGKRDLHASRKEKGLQRLGIYLEKSLIERAKKVAQDRGMSFQQLAHDSFEKAISEHENSRDTEAPVRPEEKKSTAVPVRRTGPKSQPS